MATTTLLPGITITAPNNLLNAIQNNISVGAVPTPVQTNDPGPSGINQDAANAQSPAQTIANALLITSNYTIYQFPADLPKYYFNINLSQYSRQSVSVIGQQQTYASIILPLPQNITEMHDVKWAEAELGLAVGGAASILSNRAKGDQLAGAGVVGAGAAAVAPLIAGADVLGVGAAVGAVGNLGKSLYGFSPNQFQTILFVGPTYRRMGFKWKLIPKTWQESETLRQIVQVINNAEAPAIDGSGLIFMFPDILTCSFLPNSKWLYKFKPAVIQRISANMMPGGAPSFYHNANGDNPPESIEIELQLLELEYWTKGNFTGSNIPTDVYQHTAQALDASISELANKLRNGVDAITTFLGEQAPNQFAPNPGPTNPPTGPGF